MAEQQGGCRRKFSYGRRKPAETALYSAVRENLATFLEQADEVGRGLPKFINRELFAYLRCGVLAHGFVRVRCGDCKDEMLVGFSCKGRGICPSCNSKRSHVTAAHLADRVLPHIAYRQWTLSFPIQFRWALARNDRVLSKVLDIFIRCINSHQRQVAKRLGIHGKLKHGAVAMKQFFGSSLQATPHFHVLVPEGAWTAGEGGSRFETLPPPTTEEVERLCSKVRAKVLRLLEKEGLLEPVSPEDALDVLKAHGIQRQFSWGELGLKQPPKKNPRSAFIEGFSLHANTHVHENDRAALERLCRSGLRGAVSMERLTRREDGKFVYRVKKARADGKTEIVFTGLELLRKLVALIPPPRSNLVRYFGVFSPASALRADVIRNVPSAAAEPESVTPERAKASGQPAASVGETKPKGRAPRLDWAGLLRRTFSFDVFECSCGGKRRVIALINKRSAAKAILEHLGIASDGPTLAPAHGPPEQMELAG